MMVLAEPNPIEVDRIGLWLLSKGEHVYPTGEPD